MNGALGEASESGPGVSRELTGVRRGPWRGRLSGVSVFASTSRHSEPSAARVPMAEDPPARHDGVLAVLFLVFNEGCLATGADTDPVRTELTAEAIRLTPPGARPAPRPRR